MIAATAVGVTRWQAAHDKAGRTEAEERVLYLRVLYLAVGAGALLGASGVLVSAAAVRGVLGPLTTLGEPSGVWRIPPVTPVVLALVALACWLARREVMRAFAVAAGALAGGSTRRGCGTCPGCAHRYRAWAEAIIVAQPPETDGGAGIPGEPAPPALATGAWPTPGLATRCCRVPRTYQSFTLSWFTTYVTHRTFSATACRHGQIRPHRALCYACPPEHVLRSSARWGGRVRPQVLPRSPACARGSAMPGG